MPPTSYLPAPPPPAVAVGELIRWAAVRQPQPDSRGAGKVVSLPRSRGRAGWAPVLIREHFGRQRADIRWSPMAAAGMPADVIFDRTPASAVRRATETLDTTGTPTWALGLITGWGRVGGDPGGDQWTAEHAEVLTVVGSPDRVDRIALDVPVLLLDPMTLLDDDKEAGR